MSDLFDFAESERRKREGMQIAADNKSSLLEQARAMARSIARAKGTVTADDVAEAMVKAGLSVHALGNAAGSIFRLEFEWTGERIKSARPHSHSNELKVWKLKSRKTS